MSDIDQSNPGVEPEDTSLRDEIARSDALLFAAPRVAENLLLDDNNMLFSDEIVARLKGMIGSLATQITQATSLVAEQQIPMVIDELHQHLMADHRLIEHVHSLAIEFLLSEKLQARNSIDPVVSSLLQSLIADDDPETVERAMASLSAQARFSQQQKRMEVPFSELPPMLQSALLPLAANVLGAEADLAKLKGKENQANRIDRLTSLCEHLGGRSRNALQIHEAGVGIFLTAFSMGIGLTRETAAMLTTNQHNTRMAIALRSLGMKNESVEHQLRYLNPEATLPEAFAGLCVKQANHLMSGNEAAAG